ncbi:MAG TPA: M28 family peptidase [Planctomycetota bacterium]|nr:M28 family peptidase [Planctomycetota bacterium]
MGHEFGRLDRLAGTFNGQRSVALEHDACGGLIVRRAGDTSPVRLLIAVGVDEPGYVVSQIREDGLLRVRTVGVRLGEAFHLAREGRPVVVFTRDSAVPGVLLVSSLHLRAPRPEVFDEDDLWLDVGADSPGDVAALGIGLLDPVVMSETVRLAGNRTAGTAAGARALADVLAGATAAATQAGQLAEGVAVAFVAQSQVGISLAHDQAPVPAPLGRGGEAVVRRLRPAETIILRAAVDVPDALRGPDPVRGEETAWKVLELRVRYAGTPVETVDDADRLALAGRLWTLLGATGDVPALPPVGSYWKSIGSTPQRSDPDAFRLLQSLVLPRGVSGHEGPVRDEIRRQLADINPAWKPEEDSGGNLVLVLGEGPHTYAFAAHMDEIGLQVKAIHDDGLLETTRRGGMLPHLYRETVMELVTHDGRVLPCVALPRPKDSKKEEDPPILLDVGARSAAEAAALGVAVGDTATVPKELNALGAHRAAGRSNDDRVGCAALLLALRELGPDADARLRAAQRRVVFAFTAREEVGLEGADVLARNLRPVPEVVFAVDTFVTSDSPLEDPRYAFARLGDGPVLRALDNSSLTPVSVLDRVRAVAGPAGIPLQLGTMGGGNDGSRFVPEGSIDCPLAWPQRCSHSRVETLDLRDLQALGHLLAVVAQQY